LGPTAVGILFETACVGTTVSAPVCMVSVNTAAGLGTAYLLAQCHKAHQLCKKKCEEDSCNDGGR
jgi:hypothetical protein